MFIGDILVAQDLVTKEDVAEARRMQSGKGWSFGECLVKLGRIAPEALEAVIAAAPVSPVALKDTGVAPATLLNLLIKVIYTAGIETPTEFAEVMKLPLRVVLDLIEEAEQRQLVTIVGASVSADIGSERRYVLTKTGIDWAQDAMQRSEYVGPAPVSLTAFSEQILLQRLENERIDQAAIDGALGDLVVSRELFAKLGPAINSSRSILLYGPPGNGKTSIAERIGLLFGGMVWVPYCFDVDGQIIKVFDPGVHEPLEGRGVPSGRSLHVNREQFDPRWQPCRRPFLIVGGELTPEMLELGFKPQAKFYEAPIHIKAMGGVCLIDDFGRQLVTPKALLNRWIVPLESGRDRLKLHSGKSFSLPFDELVVFATNLAPHDLMDAAFLRRIPYKVEVAAPSTEEYRAIFKMVAAKAGMEATDALIDGVIAELQENNAYPLASYQPKFIVDQIRAASRFAGVPPAFEPALMEMALSNLHTKGTPGYGVATPRTRQPRLV
jgi:hypothetical protein